jgi:N-acetylgalactosamine-N,N'-diacetylbacillosaminyl-diphospho-undecaprenol 4-alpha-N-acetylgalactosaminyltransferase
LKSRLIFFIPTLAGGGAERVASYLIPYLNNHFDLLVALIEKKIDYSIPDTLKIRFLSEKNLNLTGHISNFPLHLSKFISIIREFKPDAVLSFMEQANIINILSSFAGKHKTIISQRTNPIKQYENKGLLGKIIKFLSKTLYKKADKILSVSQGIKNKLAEHYDIREKNIFVIPNPVLINPNEGENISKNLPDNKPYILNVGRLDIKTKGLDVLLRAFLIISKTYPDIYLVIVGDGKDRENIINLAKSLQIAEKVILAGWQKNPFQYMKDAELFILSSNYEGWPNVIIEAMAQGCPVIATDCETGPKEIIKGNEFGILAPVNNSEEIARAALRILSDKNLKEYYKEMGIKRASEFDIEIIGKNYEDVIKSVISQ